MAARLGKAKMSSKKLRFFLPQEAGPAKFPWLRHHSDQAAATQGEYGGACPICLACWIGCHIQSPGGSFLHHFSQERHYPCPLLDCGKLKKKIRHANLLQTITQVSKQNYHKAHGTAGPLGWYFSYWEFIYLVYTKIFFKGSQFKASLKISLSILLWGWRNSAITSDTIVSADVIDRTFHLLSLLC